MNKKEKELFLQLCRFKDPNNKKIAKLIRAGATTPELLGYIFANRMAAIAHGVLKKAELLGEVDREFRNSLKNAATLNERINDDFFGCVRFLSAELEGAGVPYALLKGAYLCHKYPRGYRTSNDIDVLVSPENVGKISTKLKLAGFKQGYIRNGVFVPATRQQIIESKMMRGETVPFIKETKLPFIKYLEVDLNFSLDYKNSDDEILKMMLERTEVETIGASKIRRLDKYDFLLHLCAHLHKEATTMPWIRMKRDMTFYKYCDIYALLYDMTDEEVEALYERAIENGMESELDYCIKSINDFFETEYKMLTDGTTLCDVVSPADKKLYRYREENAVKRFFASDRIRLLSEVRIE